VIIGFVFLICWPVFLNNARNVNNLRKQWKRGDFVNDREKLVEEVCNAMLKKMEEERKLTSDDKASILANDNGKSSLIENIS
jgi:hypothetical protein